MPGFHARNCCVLPLTLPLLHLAGCHLLWDGPMEASAWAGVWFSLASQRGGTLHSGSFGTGLGPHLDRQVTCTIRGIFLQAKRLQSNLTILSQHFSLIIRCLIKVNLSCFCMLSTHKTGCSKIFLRTLRAPNQDSHRTPGAEAGPPALLLVRGSRGRKETPGRKSAPQTVRQQTA